MSRRQNIEDSLELAAAHGVDLTPLVYARLFANRPELEEKFCLDRNGAVRGSMLTHVIEVLLDHAGERTYAEAFVQSETVNHEGTHGISAKVFSEFYDHLAATVRDLAGAGWSSSMEAAWRDTIDDLRRVSTMA